MTQLRTAGIVLQFLPQLVVASSNRVSRFLDRERLLILARHQKANGTIEALDSVLESRLQLTAIILVVIVIVFLLQGGR